jgi:ParB/RepB/Spo0J family partition protein
VEMNVQMAAIGRFKVAPENPRAEREVENLDALAANIKQYGLLQPVLCYTGDRGALMVIAGRRRLAAALAAGLEELPYLLRPKSEALAVGLAENNQRVEMHPADEARAWSRMVDAGESVTAIANAFGVGERLVQQRLALAHLHPTLFEAFRTDQISLGQAKAWANAPAERQAAVLDRIGPSAQPWAIERELTEGKLAGDDRLARFVGEEFYRSNGGTIEQALFSEHDIAGRDLDDDDDSEPDQPATYWLDRELADKLAQRKLNFEVEKLKKQGWGWVEVGEQFPYNRLLEGAPCKTKAEKAEAGCFVSIDWHGALDVRKNLRVRAATVRQPEIGADAAPQADMSNPTHMAVTVAAGRIVGRAMLQEPKAAMVALLGFLLRDHFRGSVGGYYTGSEILRLRTEHEGPDQGWPQLRTDKAWKQTEALIAKRFEGKWDAVEEEIANWTRKEQDALLAFLVGSLTSCTEGFAAGANGKRRARLAAVSKIAGVGPSPGIDPESAWQPDARFFKGCSQAYLAKVADELGVQVQKTKGKTAEALAAAVEAKGWLPHLAKELLGLAPSSLPPEPQWQDDDVEDLTDADAAVEAELATAQEPEAA